MKQSDLIDPNPNPEAAPVKAARKPAIRKAVVASSEARSDADPQLEPPKVRVKRAPRVKLDVMPESATTIASSTGQAELLPVSQAVLRVRQPLEAPAAPYPESLAPPEAPALTSAFAQSDTPNLLPNPLPDRPPRAERPPRGPRRARGPRIEAGSAEAQGLDSIVQSASVEEQGTLVEGQVDSAEGNTPPIVAAGGLVPPRREDGRRPPRHQRAPRDGIAPEAGFGEAGERPTGPRPERGPRPGRGARPERGPRPSGPRDRSMDRPLSAEEAAEPIPSVHVEAPLGLSIDPTRRRDRNEPSEFDEKLHKVLADAGIGSRREMEDLIQAGRISVNGRPAHTGQRVAPSDQIRVNGRTLKRANVATPTQVLLYHKPSGEICTRDDPQRRSTVYERLPRLKGARWVAVGRLDFNTEGLLVFTTSGDLANKLMHPRYGWEREYAVRVLGRINEDAQKRLLDGIQLEDGIAKVNSISEIGGEAANAWYKVCISEGRNREVRRLMEAVGVIVSRLVRVRFGPIGLPPGLSRTRWVELTPTDVFELDTLVKKQVLTSEGRDPAEIEALLSAAVGARRKLAERDLDDDYDDEARPDFDDESTQVYYEDEPIPAYVDAGVVDDSVPELVGEQAEDDWQPRSANAHLEGISKVVRKGDKSKGAKTARVPRGRGFVPGQGAGPGRGGPSGAPTFGVRAGAGGGQGKGRNFKDRSRGAAPAGIWDPSAPTGPWTGGPMGPAFGGGQDRPQGGRPGRGPRPNGPGNGPGGPSGPGGRRPGGQGPRGPARGKGQGGQGQAGQGQAGQGQAGQGQVRQGLGRQGQGVQGQVGRGQGHGQGNGQGNGQAGRPPQGVRRNPTSFPAEGQGFAPSFEPNFGVDGNVAEGVGAPHGRTGAGRDRQGPPRGKPRRPNRSGPKRTPEGQGGGSSGGSGGPPPMPDLGD